MMLCNAPGVCGKPSRWGCRPRPGDGQLDTFDFFEVLEEFMGPGEEG